MKTANSITTVRSLIVKCLLLSGIILSGVQLPVQAQDTLYTRPSWMFGVAASPNFNFYRGSTQELNADKMAPAAFHDGTGIGLFLAPFVEYHRPDSRFGFLLQAGFDGRGASFEQFITPCNCPADLSVKLNYLTIEPLIRFNPMQSGLYLFAGPRVAINLTNEFTYKQGINPNYPDQEAYPDVNGALSSVDTYLLSMQVGAGYDIPLSSRKRQTQFVLSPFVSYQPYFGQDPRTIETLNITTVRVGLALKFGRGHSISHSYVAQAPVPVIPATVKKDSVVKVIKPTPVIVPTTREVQETVPLLNYVYFDLESTDISDRYVLLKKDQVSAFSSTPLTNPTDRVMPVYYNVLNILGDRMVKNPISTIRLVGSSEKGPNDGQAMAESVKSYLVDVFEISRVRIAVEGRNKPKIPSEQPGGTRELVLLRQSDRRVTIETASTELMKEVVTMHELPVEEKVNLRYNVLFEFNDAKSIKMSEKFLSEVVVPSIPDKATVIIRGYTDITGSEANNQSLSLARANAVHSILKKSLAASNRTDVQFEVYGEGENDKTSPFNNTYPEDRAYNRTVVIDINKSL